MLMIIIMYYNWAIQVMIELPYTFFQTILYGVIVYAMMGFEWTLAKFFWYIFFMYFTLLYFTYYGMMCVGLTPNASVSAIISSAFYGVWNLFSGFLIPRPVSTLAYIIYIVVLLAIILKLKCLTFPFPLLQRIPVWWRWYYWGCPIAWSLYGLLASQFGDYNDQQTDILRDVPGEPTVTAFLNSYFGYRHDFLGAVAGVILGINLLFAVVYAYSLKAFNFQRR